MEKVYALAMKKETLEEPSEVFVRAFSTLDKAIEAQEEAVEIELAERSDENLVVERFEDEYETLVSDDAGGYTVYSVSELTVE